MHNTDGTYYEAMNEKWFLQYIKHHTQDPWFSPAKRHLALKPVLQCEVVKGRESANSVLSPFLHFFSSRSFFVSRSEARKREKARMPTSSCGTFWFRRYKILHF
jgi:hypothetical protein